MPGRENNICKGEVGSYLIDQDIIMMSLLLVQTEREIRHYVSMNKLPIVWALCSWVFTLNQKRNIGGFEQGSPRFDWDFNRFLLIN